MAAAPGFRELLVMTSLLFITVLPAHAGDWFVEGGLGGSPGAITHVRYDDPVGSIFTVNAKEGTGIIPRSLSESPWSAVAAFSAGHRAGDHYFLRATYRYFGARSVTGNGLFFFNPMDPQQISPPLPQTITTTAHGVFLGAGIEVELGEDWFIDASVEVGAALVRAHGIRDGNTGLQQPFPSLTRVNLAYGAGPTIGKRLNSNLAIQLAMNWDYLGRANTGTAPDIGGAQMFAPGVPPIASMTAKVKAASIMLEIRYDF